VLIELIDLVHGIGFPVLDGLLLREMIWEQRWIECFVRMREGLELVMRILVEEVIREL